MFWFSNAIYKSSLAHVVFIVKHYPSGAKPSHQFRNFYDMNKFRIITCWF